VGGRPSCRQAEIVKKYNDCIQCQALLEYYRGTHQPQGKENGVNPSPFGVDVQPVGV